MTSWEHDKAPIQSTETAWHYLNSHIGSSSSREVHASCPFSPSLCHACPGVKTSLGIESFPTTSHWEVGDQDLGAQTCPEKTRVNHQLLSNSPHESVGSGEVNLLPSLTGQYQKPGLHKSSPVLPTILHQGHGGLQALL